MLKLTTANYHSVESSCEYMSVHQFSDWMDCPARTKAMLAGEWKEELKPAFLVGSYVDIALLTPDEMPEFLEENASELFNKPKKGELIGWLQDNKYPTPEKATIDEIISAYPRALTAGSAKAAKEVGDRCIEKAQNDELFMEYLEGEHQQILTFDFAGCTWKTMHDNINPDEERDVDLKTARTISGEDWIRNTTILHVEARRHGDDWKPKWQKGPWYEVFNYWRQAAVYRLAVEKVLGFIPDFFLAPVTKEDPPNIDLFLMSDVQRFDHELQEIEDCMPRVLRWKSGQEDVLFCDDCAYCRSVKKASIQDARSVKFIL